jgi:hypothetical protein
MHSWRQLAAAPSRKPSDSVKAAWIGALAGSLVAAALTGWIALTTVRQQIVAEDQRSTTEFLRQEQKTAYSAWLIADEKSRESEDQWANMVAYAALGSARTIRVPSWEGDIDAAESKAYVDFESLKAARSSLSLVGSRETVRIADVGYQAHVDRLGLIYLGKAPPVIRIDYEAAEQSRAARSRFIDRARAELGSDVEYYEAS